jgi:hypothetical protein
MAPTILIIFQLCIETMHSQYSRKYNGLPSGTVEVHSSPRVREDLYAGSFESSFQSFLWSPHICLFFSMGSGHCLNVSVGYAAQNIWEHLSHSEWEEKQMPGSGCTPGRNNKRIQNFNWNTWREEPILNIYAYMEEWYKIHFKRTDSGLNLDVSKCGPVTGVFEHVK